MGIMHSYDDNLCLHGNRALIRKNVRLPCSTRQRDIVVMPHGWND